MLTLLAAPALARPVHRMRIEVRGPIALVEVERSLDKAGAAGEERVLDLDLPDGAALAALEVLGDGGPLRLAPGEAPAARAAYERALAAVPLRASRESVDEGTDLRVRVSGGPETRLRYRYAAPIECRRGRFVLRIPGVLEADPLPAEVTVVFAAGSVPAEADLMGVAMHPRAGTLRATAPARATWELTFLLPPAAFPAQALAATGAVSGGAVLAVGVCRPEAGGTEAVPPERVLIAIDRSRSVGPAGIGGERDLALALLEALPPSVRFNVLFFDRKTSPLFPLSRAATAEALSAIGRETTPAQLQNGTSLPEALRALSALAARDPDGATARTWMAVITDGALPESTGAAALREAAPDAPTAVLLLRPRHDDPVPPPSIAALAAIASRAGGALRSIDPASARDGIAEVAAALRRGGDLFDVTVTAGEPATLAAALAPGAGAHRTARIAGAPPAAVLLAGRLQGKTLSRKLVPARLPAEAAALLRAPAPWGAVSRKVAALVEPGPRTAPPPDGIVRGELDRQVVRNSLSLAFLPRARACYVSRRVKQGVDLELRGRMKVELHLERGEMQEARVRSSTLARPDIEACLREAAFSLEIPRPLHRDAPAVAVLNLVFQPRTGPGGADASAISREIDLLIGPVSYPTDPKALLGDP